jgi:LDH2 family malate/lactate/ureidoglycolate dehydrogenase
VSTATVLVRAQQERDVVGRALMRHGAPATAAALQADWLVEADLRGHSSHGVARLPTLVARMRRDLILPAAEPKLDWRSDSVLSVDGGRGFGPVVARQALDEATARASASGLVLVAIANANHLGILAPYVELIAGQGLIGIASTTSEALVHPWGGRVAMVGTNPLAIAVPAEPMPLVVDMATGEVSMGRILHRLQLAQPLDPGWAVDRDGAPTTDPFAASQGAISPFGGPKGFALGLALEVIVASLTGTAFGRDVHGTLDSEEVCNKGDVFFCIDPMVVAGRSGLASVSGYLAQVRATPAQPGTSGVRIPGERASSERAQRETDGVELAAASWNEACALADGVAYPEEGGHSFNEPLASG